jgi:DNA-directed RNA polymerase subunit RPC12/RpoP
MIMFCLTFHSFLIQDVYTCRNCDHENEDLEPDEDGDLVCEECGHVIPPVSAYLC